MKEIFQKYQNIWNPNLFQGQTCLVTGGTRGIGKELVYAFASLGAQMVFTYQKSKEEAFQIVENIEKEGGKAYALNLDLNQKENIPLFIQTLEENKIKIQILINNAGMTKDNLIIRQKEEDITQVIQTNLQNTILLTQYFVKSMLSQKQGNIIFLSSVIGNQGNAGQTIYAATKAGLMGFCKSLAKEIGSRQIRVNCITPGFVSTDMTQKLPENILQEAQKRITLGRFGNPEDVAGAALFLDSPMSSYITGQSIIVDGLLSL